MEIHMIRATRSEIFEYQFLYSIVLSEGIFPKISLLIVISMIECFFQILFKRSLSSKQWLSLLILTVGCMIHASGSGSELTSGSENSEENLEEDLVKFGMGCVFILVQVLCSVVAGVYNEYLIKSDGADIHIMIQNVFMYLDSIFCNALLLGAKVKTTFMTDRGRVVDVHFSGRPDQCILRHLPLLTDQPSGVDINHKQCRPRYRHQFVPQETQLHTESLRLCSRISNHRGSKCANTRDSSHPHHCDGSR